MWPIVEALLSLSLSILTAVFPGEPGLTSFIGAKGDGRGGDNLSYSQIGTTNKPTSSFLQASNPSCICGNPQQTIDYKIVNRCPITRFPGGLWCLHHANEDAVSWLIDWLIFIEVHVTNGHEQSVITT